MERQHTENLFRRYKGEIVNVKTVSSGSYEGRVAEITNDYVCLIGTGEREGSQIFLFFHAIELMIAVEAPET